MAKTRSGAVKLNMISGFVHELVILIFGLVVPRIVLSYFGSTYNGLQNSIVQFLSFSVVLRSGLGVVTTAALYKPLAQGDMKSVSGIMVATDKFMQKVGWLLAGIIVAFALLYPLLVLDEFNYLFSATLILIVGASSWVENMFSIKYKILLQADQKTYIQTVVIMIAYVLSNVLAIVLMVAKCNIHIVRFGMLLGHMSTPFLLKLYVDRHYDIDWKVPANNVAIKSRWDAFAQQIATVANNNIPTILMTFLFPLKEISVYTVYHMVVKNINQLISNSVIGIRSTFGNMYAKGEIAHLKKRFQDVEWMIYAVGAVMYTVTAIMLTPFVLVYTRGVTDADYNRFWFGLLMTASCYVYMTRLPYQMVAEAVGYFKETRNSAILEIVLNIIVSLACAPFIGIHGILVGTLVGGAVRTGNLMWVCNRKALKLSLWLVVKNYAVYFGTSAALVFVLTKWVAERYNGYIQWALAAISVTAVVGVAVLAVSFIFNRKQLMGILTSVLRRKRK